MTKKPIIDYFIIEKLEISIFLPQKLVDKRFQNHQNDISKKSYCHNTKFQS